MITAMNAGRESSRDFSWSFSLSAEVSKLLHGARPRIPADPLKRRNTSIALEELRRGLLTFRGKNGNELLTIPTAIDSVGNTTVVEQVPDFDLPKAE